MLIGIIIAVLLIGAVSLTLYELTRPTPPRTCAWRPTVDAPGSDPNEDHAMPTDEPVIPQGGDATIPVEQDPS